MPGSEKDPVQLDPFQEVTEVNWDLRALPGHRLHSGREQTRAISTRCDDGRELRSRGGWGQRQHLHEGRSVFIWSGDLGVLKPSRSGVGRSET